MGKHRAVFGAFAVIALAGGSLAIGGASAGAAAEKVTICHRTNSDTNPYVEISPSANGVLNGHAAQHNDQFIWAPGLKASGQMWGDIIPAFDDFPGLNLTTHGTGTTANITGQDILNNGCVVPEGPSLPTPGTLKVTKAVAADSGPAPQGNVAVSVDCGDGTITQTLAIPASGGSGSVTDIPADMDCTVQETDSAGATNVAYSPSDTVTIVTDDTVEVTVTNTYAPTAVLPEDVVKPADPSTPAAAPAAVVVSPAFTG